MNSALPAPATLTIYMLLRQSTTFSLMPVGFSGGSNPMGSGFFWTREEAEAQRTIETLRTNDDSRYFVYELSVPNPAWRPDARDQT